VGLSGKNVFMLIGQYSHTLDEKNRISLPAKFRREMGKKVILAPGLDQCIAMYTESEWKRVSAKLGDSSVLASDNRSFSRFMFGGAVETPLDGAGRILIPDFLKERANLKSKVIVIGVQNRIEIWNERIWEDYKQQIDAKADQLAEKLGQLGVL
jgi:MraZ protein